MLCFKYEAAQMIKQEHVECPIPYCRLSVHGDLTFIASGALLMCSKTGWLGRLRRILYCTSKLVIQVLTKCVGEATLQSLSPKLSSSGPQTVLLSLLLRISAEPPQWPRDTRCSSLQRSPRSRLSPLRLSAQIRRGYEVGAHDISFLVVIVVRPHR